MLYEVSLNEQEKELVSSRVGEDETPLPEQVQEAHNNAVNAVIAPWDARTKKKRRRWGAHVKRELLRLWKRRKKLYDRMIERPTELNKQEHKLACQWAQRRERQLLREHKRRVCQRILHDPNTEISKALRTTIQKRSRQKALDRATGMQLKPKLFVDYLNGIMSGEKVPELTARQFTVDEERHTANVITAIN